MAPSLYTATLVSARTLSPSVRELTFDAGGGFRFVPGQWVSFRIPHGDGEILPRAYSIASAPRDGGRFDVAVTRVENGPGSAFLHAMEPGRELTMTHAQGFFTLDAPARPVLFVGTGTGLSPLRSMLHGWLGERDAERFPTAVLFGVRTEQDLLYGSELEELAKREPWFRFEPTLSRGGDDWSGRRGYVQAHLRELVGALGGDCDVYVCGLNKMIREVRRVLKEDLGFTRERIHTERYD